MQIEQLPIEFIGRAEVKGFTFKLIHRDTKYLIYQVNTGDSIHYELFEIKLYDKKYDFKTKEQTVLETPIERYPKSGEFGRWAWTHPTLELSKQKIETLKNN